MIMSAIERFHIVAQGTLPLSQRRDIVGVTPGIMPYARCHLAKYPMFTLCTQSSNVTPNGRCEMASFTCSCPDAMMALTYVLVAIAVW